MIDWDEAKAAPIAEVVDALDLGPIGRDGKIFCWNHPEDTPSVHVYEQENRYWSYCCGKGGNVINLVAEVCGTSNGRAARWILSTGLEPVDLPDRPARKEPTDFTDRINNETSKRFLETGTWLEQHWPALEGHGAEVTARFDLRWTLQHLWIPHRHDGTVPGVKTRLWLNGAKASLKGSQYRHLYRPLGGRHNTAVLCEGESDTWCMWAHTDNIDVVGLPSGAQNISDEVINELNEYDTVWLCLDDDKAGIAGTEELMVKVPEAYDIEVPGGRVAEALAEHWTPHFLTFPQDTMHGQQE